MLFIALGAAHTLAAVITSGRAGRVRAQQEVSSIMAAGSGDQQSGQVPTLGEIGQHLGGFFHGMTPR
jgi:hypothetical protein